MAAAENLLNDGWFVFCFPWAQKDRALKAVAYADLSAVRIMDVIPRASLTPLITLFACRHRSVSGGVPQLDPPFIVRAVDGNFTLEMLGVRRGFGFQDANDH